MKFELQYKRYSESAILIEWPPEISEEVLNDLLSYKNFLEKSTNELIVEVISAYSSLLVCYKYTIENVYSEISILKSHYSTNFECTNAKKRLWEIPVCYSTALAPDLKSFSSKKSLTIDEVISLHSTPIYTIYFIGFLPGFLYLGGLPKKLHLSRKATPSLTVKKGAVAIGGNQTGIYPSDSPGGWHVIGICPLDFFDPTLKKPCFFEPGDLIKFKPIDNLEYNAIRSKIIQNKYQLDPVVV
ncbi:5-oxoprolinase subunit PxpB [Aquimarina sp. 2304DJ70-9]|uniref:5-oxoprolinase subunit PxpB n=1 Tax=Aquimarina penaris TaxID=3231044 RepID=UPI003461DE09